MLTCQYANVVSFFYPLGNTPAVSLTQSLPPEKQADVLVLGSGDVRHVLFTIHTDHRTLDFTCCDVERAVIARNILLLSLTLDDIDGTNKDLAWNLYYHFRIDEASLRLLRNQARKLHSIAVSLAAWHESSYGKIIKLCDQGSLEQVKEMWDFYGAKKTGKEGAEQRLDASIQKAKQHKDRHGFAFNLTGFRSALPAPTQSIQDLSSLHQQYWENGTTDLDPSTLSSAVHANPMFVSLDDNVIMHYGTDPLLGFHLAAAYVPLSATSPLFHSSAGPDRLKRVVEVAKTEFYSWTASFRKHAHSVNLRCFIGDALAFSHSLQQLHNARSTSNAHLYRDRFHFEPLVLDGELFAHKDTVQRGFNVIDTSNLIDHLGALNLLVAAAPLLAHDMSATLYTEKLARSDSTHSDLFDRLLCGPLPTVSMLLGLTPLDFVTNTSATSVGEEIVLNGATNGQLFTRIAWKRPIYLDGSPQGRCPQRIKFEPAGLASILYQIYLKMFENEDLTQMMSNVTMFKLKRFSIPTYQRASFVAFVRGLRSRTSVDWSQTVDALLDLMESNSSHLLTRNYFQELSVWLRLLDMPSVPTLECALNPTGNGVKMNDLRDWKNAPAVVCVTLKVPRDQLAVFTDGDLNKTGTPTLCCSVQGSSGGRPWHNAFAAIQTGFGQVETSGTPFSAAFEVRIIEDRLAWGGTSSLWVSFYAPTWMLLLQPRTASVAFGLQSTPQSTQAFLRTLGVQLNVYQTILSDAEHIYISKHLPNQSATPSFCNVPVGDAERLDSIDFPADTTITALVDSTMAKVVSLTGRLDMRSTDCKNAIQAGGRVSAVSRTPFNFIVSVEPGRTLAVDFPLPMLDSGLKLKVARKSSYVELILQVADAADWSSFRSFMSPVFLDSGVVTNWNIPYLNLQSLPDLDGTQPARLSWLTTHTSMMFTPGERSLRDNDQQPASEGERTRVEFKDSIFSLFMHSTGLQGEHASLFGIHCPTEGGVHILIFVSCLRLDLSNRTAVLDVAVLPLYDSLMPQISSFLRWLTQSGRLCQIHVTGAELRVWKQLLPALVERCRTWSHTAECEYLVERRVPLSMEKGQRLLCSCGDGRMPPGYVTGVPEWKKVAKYAVRAAISPCFSAAMFQSGHDIEQLVKAAQEKKAEACNSCGRDSKADGSALLKCARCRTARYCSQQCQRVDWKKHKTSCAAT